MNKIIYARISGRGEFPVDMLRRDLCSPATEEDSGLISSTFKSFDKWVIFVKRPLLERRRKNDPVFTIGRWNSFGCEIVEVSSPYQDRPALV
jgi:hypothetical protein